MTTYYQRPPSRELAREHPGVHATLSTPAPQVCCWCGRPLAYSWYVGRDGSTWCLGCQSVAVVRGEVRA